MYNVFLLSNQADNMRFFFSIKLKISIEERELSDQLLIVECVISMFQPIANGQYD